MMTKARHGAWEPRWYRMAPGVRWQLEVPSDLVKLRVARQVADAMRRIHDPAELLAIEQAPVSADGVAGDVVGRASIIAACFYAKALLRGWEGMADLVTGRALKFTDAADIQKALIYNEPGSPLVLTAFLAWLESCAVAGPEYRAMAKPLAARAAGEAVEVTSETCRLCWSIFDSSPDLWVAGAGLDFHNALLTFEDRRPGLDGYDIGAAYLAFEAIDEGRRSVSHG